MSPLPETRLIPGAQCITRLYSTKKPISRSLLFDLSNLSLQSVNIQESTGDNVECSEESLSFKKKSPPKLSFGLDRVLFNPGVFTLRDIRTNVYNFDEYLKDIMQPEWFEQSLLPVFQSAAKDSKLHQLGKIVGASFVSSTSSITSMMQQLYLLLSEYRPPSLTHLSKAFDSEPKGFANALKDPVSFIITPHLDGKVRSVVVESYDSDNVDSHRLLEQDVEDLPDKKTGSLLLEETESILCKLGNTLEKLLTLSRNQFEGLKKGAEHPYKPTQDAYQFTKAGPLLLRSQLDCCDDRLPRRSFDLKTRGVHPIRMDVSNYKSFTHYKIKNLYGLYESYEREQYDLIRSTMLKYNFQVRIGDMDGIFVTYHNTKEIFGFQYITREEMDSILYGSSEFGDAAYNYILQVLSWLLERVSSEYKPTDTIRLTFHHSCGPLAWHHLDDHGNKASSFSGKKIRVFSEAVQVSDPGKPSLLSMVKDLNKKPTDLRIFDIRSRSLLKPKEGLINQSAMPIHVSELDKSNVSNWLLNIEVDQVPVLTIREKEYKTIRSSILKKNNVDITSISDKDQATAVPQKKKRGRFRSPMMNRVLLDSASQDLSQRKEGPIQSGYWTKVPSVISKKQTNNHDVVLSTEIVSGAASRNIITNTPK
jgi:hypothetical protein